MRDVSNVKLSDANLEIIKAEVTKPDSLKNLFNDVRVVISTVGITRQKDNLTYRYFIIFNELIYTLILYIYTKTY